MVNIWVPLVTSLLLISPPGTGSPVLWTGWLYSMTKGLFLSIPTLTGHWKKTSRPIKHWFYIGCHHGRKPGDGSASVTSQEPVIISKECSKTKPAAVWRTYLQLITANQSPNSCLDNYSQWCWLCSMPEKHSVRMPTNWNASTWPSLSLVAECIWQHMH